MSNIEFKSFGEVKSCKDCLNNDVCKKQHDIEANPGLCTFYKRKDDYRKERQGEWIPTSSLNKGFALEGYMFCSECDVMLHTCDDNYYCLDKLNYCPMCGARMKGE